MRFLRGEMLPVATVIVRVAVYSEARRDGHHSLYRIDTINQKFEMLLQWVDVDLFNCVV